MTLLRSLNLWLKSHNLNKEAQEVKELEQYEEPWHEEAVQEFGGEPISEEEYLNKNFPPQKTELLNELSLYRKILEQEHFRPLESIDKEVNVGAGAFGLVFRGVYQGKPAVAKVIAESTRYISEVEKWNAIAKVTPQLPPNLQKHTPAIYHTNVGSVTLDDGREQPYQIIIMEELLPLSPHLKEIIMRQQETTKDNLNRLLKDEDYLYQLAEMIYQSLRRNANFGGPKNKLQKITTQEIFQVIYGLGTLVYNSEDMITSNVADYLAKKYHLPEETKKKFKILIYNNIKKSFQYINSIPFSHSDVEPNRNTYSAYWEYLPETQSFLETLKTLSTDFGIDWNDLKPSNMMMDRDGNLKIIDVGFYNLRDISK